MAGAAGVAVPAWQGDGHPRQPADLGGPGPVRALQLPAAHLWTALRLHHHHRCLHSPIPDGLTVHALEHGHVAIQYAPTTPRAEVGALTRIARRYGADVVVAPYPRLRRGIALTAWGRLELLDHYDQARIATFVEKLLGRYVHGWAQPNDCPAGARTHPPTGG